MKDVKFYIGDKFYTVGSLHRDFFEIPCSCEVCSSTGEINVKGKTFVCPECGGKKIHDYNKSRSRYETPNKAPLTVAKITIKQKLNEELSVEYMAYETGMPSGRVYKQSDCFRTYDEALKETFKRNAEFISKEIEKYGRELTEEECGSKSIML